MFTKIASLGAMLALLVSVTAVAAQPSRTASCCVEKTRCCTAAEACCDQPAQADCCKTGTACCDMKECCAPQKKAAASTCPVTGLNRSQCCASQASPMPPCCSQGCDIPGKVLR